jgi:hypothetical protein
MAGIEGLCPKCEKGQIKQVEEQKSDLLHRGKSVESKYRIFYQCDNPQCNYQNIVIGVVM